MLPCAPALFGAFLCPKLPLCLLFRKLIHSPRVPQLFPVLLPGHIHRDHRGHDKAKKDIPVVSKPTCYNAYNVCPECHFQQKRAVRVLKLCEQARKFHSFSHFAGDKWLVNIHPKPHCPRCFTGSTEPSRHNANYFKWFHVALRID